MIPDSLQWALFRRRHLCKTVRGFQADLFTYASADSHFSEYVSLHRKTCVFSSSLGRATYVAGATLSRLSSGNFCSIGQGARMGLGMHPLQHLSTHPAFYSSGGQTRLQLQQLDSLQESEKIHLGHDVWIGAHSLVMDGVRIGDGAVVGAGAVVTRDVPDYAIAVGSPAKVIRLRFDPATIALLKASQWWHLCDADIARFVQSVAPEGALLPKALAHWMGHPVSSPTAP